MDARDLVVPEGVVDGEARRRLERERERERRIGIADGGRQE